MAEFEFNRALAINYAKRWALSRNPEYYDYTGIGGDCTNFISQCIFAGSGIMNYTPDLGWYYIDANNKSPSWTGVQFFYNFMTQNSGPGPFAKVVPLEETEAGDVIQLGDRTGNFYHTLIITAIRNYSSGRRYYICAHSVDSYMRDLETYNYYDLRCLHFLGVRTNSDDEIPENLT